MPNYETKNNTQGGVDLDAYIAEREAAESANSESGLSDLDTYIAEREKQESANSESKLSDLDAYIAEREKQDAIDNQYNADRQVKLDELAVKAEALNKARGDETTQRGTNSLDADKAIAMDATSSDYKYSTKEEKLAKLQEKQDALSSAKDKYDDSFTNTLVNAKDGLVYGLKEGYETMGGLRDAAFTRVTDTIGNTATFFGDAVSNKFKENLAKKKELDTIGEEAYIAKLKKENEGNWFSPPMTTERAKLHVDYLNDMDEAVNSERAETVKTFGGWISSFTKDNELSNYMKEHQAERKKKRTSGGSINIFSGEGRMEDKINNLSDMAGSMAGDMAMMAVNAPLASVGVMANTERDYMENGRKMGLTDEELNENKAPIIAFSTALAVLGDKLKIGDASSKAVNKIMGETIESSLTKLKSAVSPRVYNAITKSLGTMTEAGFSGATEYGESIIPTLSHRNDLEKTGRFSKEDIAKKTKIDNMYDSPDFWVAALMGGAAHAKDSFKSYKESDGWKNVEAQLDNMANAETSKQALKHEAKMDENVAKTDSITKTKIAKQYNLDPQTLRDADGKMPIEVKAIVGTVNQVNTENAIKQDAVMQREQRVKELDKEYKESNDPQQRIELLKEKDNLKKEIEHIEGKEAPAESVKDNVKDGIEQGIANKTEQVAQNATESVLSNTESNYSESDIQTRPESNIAESDLKIDERTSADKEVEVETNPQMDVTKQDSKDENNINDNKSDIEPADKGDKTNREESVQKQELTPENFDGRKNPDDMTRFEMEQELGTKGGRISNLKKAVIKSRKSEIEDIKRRESGVNRLSELESEGKLNNVSELDNNIKDSNIEQSNADYEVQLKQEQEQLAKQKIEDNKSKKVNDLTHDEVMAELNTDKKLSKAQARKELKAQRERIAKSEQAEIDKVERAKRRERRNKDRNKVLKDIKDMSVEEMQAELGSNKTSAVKLRKELARKRKNDKKIERIQRRIEKEEAKALADRKEQYKEIYNMSNSQMKKELAVKNMSRRNMIEKLIERKNARDADVKVSDKSYKQSLVDEKAQLIKDKKNKKREDRIAKLKEKKKKLAEEKESADLKNKEDKKAKRIDDIKNKKDLTPDEMRAELSKLGVKDVDKLSELQLKAKLKAVKKVENLKDPKEMTIDEMKAELNVTEGTRGQLHRDIKKKRKQDAEAVDTKVANMNKEPKRAELIQVNKSVNTETKVKQEKAKPKKSKKEKKPVVDNKVDAEKYAKAKKTVDDINSRKPVSRMTLDELNAELGTESKSLARMRIRVETSRKKELAKAVKQQTISEPTTRARTPLEKILRGDLSKANKAVKSLTNKDLSRNERSQAATEANKIINDMIKKIDPAIRKEMKIPKLNVKSNMKVETIDKKIREAIVNIRKAENKQRKVTAIKDFNKVAKDAIKLTKTKDRRGIVVNPIEAKKLDLRAQLIKEGKSNKIPNRLMDTLLKVADGQVDITGLTANQINVLTNQIKKAAKSTKYEIKLAQQYSDNKIKAQALVFAEQVRGRDKQKTSQEIERERTGIKSKAKGLGKQFLDMVRIVRRQTGTKDSIMEKVMVDDIRDGEARMYNHQNNMNEDLGQMTEGYNVDKARTEMVYEKNGVKYTKSSLMAIEAYAQSKTGMDRLVLTDGILSKSSIDVLKPHIAEINGLKQEIDSIKYDKDGHKRTLEELRDSNDEIKLLALNEQMKELRATKDADILKARQEAEAVVNDLRSQLTAKEKQIVNDFITMAETKMYDISNDAYQSINGGRELGRRERYFKFKNMNRDSDATTIDALSDVNGIQQYGRRGEGGLDTGFTKEIVKNPVGFKDTFSMDFFGIANEMITDSSRYSGMALPYISASKFLKEVKPTLDNLDASTHGVLKGYLDNVIRGKVNGNDSTIDKVASSAMGLHALRTLGMSPKIMLMQGPSVLLALPHSSVKHLTIASTKAMADFTTGGFVPSKSKFVQNVYTKDPTMKARSGNIETVLADSKRILTEASKSSDSKIANGARETLLFLNKIGEAGMAGITYVDAYASSTVWTAAYDYAISKGKSEADAIRAGRRAVTETQPMSDMLSRSGIQQAGLLIKALTPYASQRKQLSNMYADVFDPRSGLSKLERVKTMVALGTSQTLITGLQNGHYAGVALLAGMATNAMLGGPDASDEQKMLASDYMIDLVADGLAAPVTSIPGGGVLDSLIMKGADTTRKSMGIKTKNDWILKHREVGSTLIGSIFNQVYKGIDGAQESGTKGDKLGSAGQIIEALSVFQGMAINNMTRPYKNFKELSKTGDVRYIFYSKYITDKAREAEAKGRKVDMEFIRRNTLDYKTKAAKEIKTQKDLDKLYIKAISQ